ncbi:MAG: SPOR domain-containing protein [Acidovorax sp.]|jgi:DedD protein
MVFFKFRWSGQGDQKQTEKPVKRPRPIPQAESVDAMRRRARHRLIGAAVLVLIAVVGFPLLFDTQPRPIPVNVPIEIPDRNKVAPLVVPAIDTASTAQSGASRPAARALAEPSGPSAPNGQGRTAPVADSRAAASGLVSGEEQVVSAPQPPAVKAGQTGTSTVPQVVQKPESKPVDPRASDPKPTPRADEASRARALLEGRAAQPPAVAEEARFIIQVGAFAEADKAREVRAKLERAGLKTYAQVVDTKDGKRTRVRLGPFGNREEADKAAARVKLLDLPASVLTL